MYGANEKYVAIPTVGESTLQYGGKMLCEHRSRKACFLIYSLLKVKGNEVMMYCCWTCVKV